MDALLDTHTYLWLTSDETQLGANALSAVKDLNNRLYLSIASEWEIAIKVGNGRLSIAVPLDELLTVVPRTLNIDLLPISARPFGLNRGGFDASQGSFDRLLVALL